MPARHHHILVVEDDQFLADAYQAELKKHGYLTTFARDGVEALAAVKANKPDLIILDLIMPRKNGIEVLKELHKRGVAKKIPVIVASNLDKPGIEEECARLGAQGFFIKSDITIADLLRQCERAMVDTSKDAKKRKTSAT